MITACHPVHPGGRVHHLTLVILTSLFVSGCGALRLAPSETQKQNAWLHQRTTAVAAQTARDEAASPTLQSLTTLAELQSRAWTASCGRPESEPPAETAEAILAPASWTLAQTAGVEAAQRPSPWQIADSLLEFGIGLAALLGGVYGTRAVRFLQDARARSRALQEIIAGNERFKAQNAEAAGAFKTAHQNQSPPTRQLVAALKN